MLVKPLEHIRIVTNEVEEKHIKALLDKTRIGGLVCSNCGSTRFVVEAWIKSKVEVLNEGQLAIITGVEHEVLYANRIIECVLCRKKEVEDIYLK